MHLTPTHPAQAFLSFIPEIEVRLRHQRWRDQEKTKKFLVKKGLTSRIPILDTESFSLLFDRVDEVKLIKDARTLFFEEVREIREILNEDVATEDDLEVVEWSDQDVYALHEVLLQASLERLEFTEWAAVSNTDQSASINRGKGLKKKNGKVHLFKSRPKTYAEIKKSDFDEARDILHWIFNPATPDRVQRTINGVNETIDIPFTCGTCSRLLGIDPDIVKHRYQHLWKSFIQEQNDALYQRYSIKDK